MIAVFTYFRNSSSRREDVALQKFNNTIEAEDYFHREFAISIDEAIAEYDSLLVYNSYDETTYASLRADIVRQIVKRINFARYFKTRNRLAA